MKDKKKKLLFVWNYLSWGGAQVYFLAIMKVARAEWDVTVLLPRASSSEFVGYLDQLGVKHEFLELSIWEAPAPGLTEKIRRQIARLRSQREIYRRLRARPEIDETVVHIEAAPWQDWILLSLLCRTARGVYVTMHNFMPRRSWLRETIWRARLAWMSRVKGFHIFASNKNTKDELRGWVSADFHRDIRVTYTCVNPPEIEAVLEEYERPGAVRERLGLHDTFTILTVGQFIDRKGRWTLLEAARRVRSEDDSIQFIWVMPGLPDPETQSKINEFGLGNGFTAVLSRSLGASRHEVLSAFRLGDVFVLPSFVEGLPIALLEAMALGIPAISTRVYAIPEAVIDDQTGILIEAGDANGLAAAILKLRNDASLREKLASSGSSFVLEHFDERVASGIAIAAYGEEFEDAD